MVIKNLLNVKESDILEKNFNILLGISLGNKFFSEENIELYLKWALNNTKKRIAFLVPDKIHAINHEVLNHYSESQSIDIAFKQGDEASKICNDLIKRLDNKSQEYIKVLRWEDIETEKYKQMFQVLNLAFKQDINFRNIIIEVVRENIKKKDLIMSDYEKLAKYVIAELPMLISGVEYEEEIYDLLPYPGISKIDYLALDLQEGRSFPEITKELDIKSVMKIIDLS